jgi:hypothetical protein
MITVTFSELMYCCGLMFSLCAGAFMWMAYRFWLMSLGLV